MAKAYLGKISALVTANTSDFNSKLNASANELRNFAKSVQSNITRTTQDANRAFSAILTPLQKFEASLRAASSMRLSFKGFAGAIKDVDELKARLATLKDSQVNLVVNASGMKSLTDFRNAIGDITNKDIRVLTDVGGIEKLRELRNIIETEDGRTIATQVRVKDVDLDRIIAKFERIDKKQIDAVIRVLGEQDLEAAVVKQQQLASAAKQVAEPLAAAVAQFGKLSTEVQTAFIPALNRAQDATQNLQSDIEAGVRIGQERFKGLEAQVLRTAEAIDRLSEAAATVSTIRTGRELEFQQPRAQAALTAARAVSGEATGNVALNPRAFEASQVAIKRESDALVELIALRESANEQGERGTASVIQAQIDTRTAALERQTAEYRRLIAAEKELQRIVVDARTDISDKIQAARLAQEEAAFRERAAEQTERQAAAANRVLAADLRRREALREQQDNFGAGIDLGPQQAPEQLFGRRQRTRDSELGRTRELERQFQALPDDVQASLAAEAKALNNIATSAKAGAAGVETLATANDRMASAIGKANASLDQQNSRAKLLDDFKRRFADFDQVLQTRAISAFYAELTVMENAVASLSQEMRGPALAAMTAYRDAVQAALAEGGENNPAVQGRLEAIKKEFIAAAKQAGMSGAQIGAALKRAGDVGRGGVDKFSLALNQAAFAIDDFFSSTGGLEFKLRAISNNVTQLAFIIGETKGLFIGLGAVLAGQAAVAILKWVNGGRTAEDQTKALNEALARQKSLVEDLAQAFRSLGESLTRDAFSPAAREANEFRKELNEIIKKQKELREARVADADPTVQLERANQNAINRRLESEENPGRRVALQRQLEESRVREREAARAANAGNATRDDVRRSLERAQASVGVAQLPAATDAGSAARREIEAARIRRQAAADAERASAGTEAQQRAAVDAEIRRLTPIAANGDALGFGSSAAAASSIEELNQVLAKLDSNGIARANNALVVSVLEGAKKVSDALAAAQSSIANADFGPSRIGAQADAAARQLESLAKQLETATDEKTIQALRAQQQALLQVSSALRSAASSVERFAAVIDRVAKQLSDTVLQEVEGRANQARREANAARGAVDAGVANVPAFAGARVAEDNRRRADEAVEDRERAERALQRARAGQQEFERRRTAAVRDFEARAEAGTLGQEAQQLIRQRDSAQAVLDDQNATPEQQQAAADTLNQVNARLDQLFESSPAGRALSNFADQLDAAAQAASELDRQIREQRASADRGRELTLSPGQRAAEQLNQQLADISNYVQRVVTALLRDGLTDEELDQLRSLRKQEAEAIKRAEADMMRQVAPTLTGMADSVRNAVLQGPSRAALNVSDATTTQGQQELNRLLRGDDPARDGDMVTLQRETNELLRAIERKDNPVAQ
jgi:hypothetical protein